MKQHITVEQLKEFITNNDAEDKIMIAIGEEEGSMSAEIAWRRKMSGGLDQSDYAYKKVAERYTIGQMIEILKEKDECVSIAHLINWRDEGDEWGWIIELRHLHIWATDKELADALWKALKSIL